MRGLIAVTPLLIIGALNALGLLRGAPFVFETTIILTNLALLTALWLGARFHTGNTRRGWLTTAVSLTAIMAAIFTWLWSYFTRSTVMFPEALEFLYLGGAILLWPAVLLLRQGDDRRRRLNIRTVIDTLVTIISVTALVWYFVLVPYAPNPLRTALFGSSPFMQVILLSVVTYSLLQTSVRQPSRLFALGIFLLLIADLGLMFVLQEVPSMSLVTPLISTAGMMMLFIDIQRKPIFPTTSNNARFPAANGVPYIMATLAIITLLLGDDIFGLDRATTAESYLIGLGLLTMLLLRQVVSIRDNQRLVRNLIATNKELQIKATTDHLTGLLNRNAFITQFSNFVHNETPIWLLFLDLNSFKQVNDTYGHAAGDIVLQSVANRITHRLAPGWIVTRTGGDEFMIALPNTKGETVRDFIEQLQEALEKPHFICSQQSAIVTAAIGAAHCPTDGQHVDDVIHTADQRMYQTKRFMKAHPL